MGSLYISDFKFGQDRRRPRVAGTPGTLWTGKNVVITRGGDIERAKRFVPTFALPAGQTFGLAEVRGQVWTFGSAAGLTMPLGVNYMQLTAPSGAAMTQILDARAANGKLYVIARYVDGNIFHFYDGARITQWDTVAAGGVTYPVLADYLASLIDADPAVTASSVNNTIAITARVPGTAFTISRHTTNGGNIGDQDITLATVQANVPAAAEVRATTQISLIVGTTGSISSVTINGVQLLYSSVSFVDTLANLAIALAQSINNSTGTHGYSAAAVGTVVTVSAAVGLGATPNGYVVASTSSGDLNLSFPPVAGGVTAVAGVAQVMSATLIGTPEAPDLFVITINGTDYKSTAAAAATGTTAFVASRRVFSTAGSLVVWCALVNLTPSAWSNATTYNLADTVLGSDNNIYSSLLDSNTGHNPTLDGGVHWQNLGSASQPAQTIWVPYTNPDNAAIGAGFINVSNDAEGSERLIGIGRYLLNQMAAMTRRNIRLYNLSTDATQIGMVQPLDNTGTLAGRSILNFGSIDLFYLADSGIRSLRPRDTTNTAFTDDIGTSIDPFVRAQIDSLNSAVFGRAVGVMEPRDDRFWLAVDNRIYVLSYFPSSQISAWTYFEPGFSVSDFARVYDRLYVRAADEVYLYGGTSGSVYPNAGEFIAEIELPFAAETPPGRGTLIGFDQAAAGEWQASVLVDPNNEDALLDIGILDGITYGEDDAATPGRATYFAINMTCSTAGYASISNITLHTDAKEAEN
jgi:hypothetical protein